MLSTEMVRSPHSTASRYLEYIVALLLSVGAAVLVSACANLEPEAGPPRQTKQADAGPAPAAMGAEPGPVVGAEAGPAGEPGAVTPRIYPGTGVFIKPPAPLGPSVEVTPVGDVTLNFADADIREVVRSILGDILKVNYVIDPSVQGTITVQTSRPLPRPTLLATLENILRLNGAALVQADDVYVVVPLEKAPRETRMLDVGPARLPRGPGFGIRIVPLKFIAAVEMQKILEPLAPQGTILRVDEGRNLLMLGATRPDLETLLETVEIFDVDWLSGMSFGLFPLEFTDPKTLAVELKKVLAEDATAPLAGLLRFVPVERLNAILVISPQAAYVEQARTWIERLDQSGDGAERRLYVYYVQNGLATELAAVLSEIFALEVPREARPVARLAPGLEPVEITPEGAGYGAQPSEPGETGAAQETERAQPAAPAGVAPEAGETITLAARGEVRIIADVATNAVVILATPADYRMVKAALEKLDIVPLQVLIEATIAEVTLTDELRYGLQWFFKTGDTTVTLSEAVPGTLLLPSEGFSFLLSATDVSVLLDALEKVTDVNIISSPQLMVLDNQTASLQVGDTVPTETGTTVAEGLVTTTVEFRDTGVILRVTPRVNAGGLVIMEIEQEVSFVEETDVITLPTIRRRTITSTVAIQSGETVALGGLIEDTQETAQSGVPILSDIPILGALFRSTGVKTERTELLVLITPRVIASIEEAREVTEELRRRLRAVIPLARRVE